MRKSNIVLLTLLCLLLSAAGSYYCYGKDSDENIWKTKENLAFRLGSEWYKIGLLSRELDAQSDILTEIRDLELFPSNLTGFVESELVKFDKKIELVEKENSVLRQRLQLLNGPLSDGIAILRELVTSEPVESMFDVLEKGDMKRINEMLAIKHDIESLWKKSDSLFTYIFSNSGITVPEKMKTGAFEDEFFQILKANLGQTSQDYYDRLDMLKNRMLQKATTAEINEIYKIERYRIYDYFERKETKLASDKIKDLLERFEGKRKCDEMYVLLARINLSNEKHQEVLKILSSVTPTDSTSQQVFLYRVQSLFALQNYEEILEETKNITISSFQGSSRNLLLLIMIECILATDSKEYEVSQLISQIVKSASYSLHAIHAFARSLLVTGDTTTALSALESSRSYSVNTPDDQKVRMQIDLTIAELHYETGNYDDALTQFYSLLKSEEMYAQSLFGIVWCYIQTGQSSKAEIALKKLINQIPESPLAAEGILIVAQRYLQKAQASWKKQTYLEHEEARLNAMAEKLLKQSTTDTSSSRSSMYAIANSELNVLMKRIHDEPRDTYNQISDYYSQILKVCELIVHHYKSGTFQEVSFSQQRESLLYYLDSVMLQLKNDGKNQNTRKNAHTSFSDRLRIKTIVDNAVTFSAVAMIDKYRWERDFIDNEKSGISKLLQKIETQSATITDSSSIKAFARHKDSLDNQMTLILRKEAEIHEYYFDKLTSRLTDLVKADIGYEDHAYFLYHLGELYYSHENRIFSDQYDFYELVYADFQTKLKAFRNGSLIELPLEPEAPVLKHDTSIYYFKLITDSENPTEYTHAACYSLAWCYNDLSKFDSALFHMEKLAATYPSSIYAAQALMYAGEYYFDKGILDKSILCYHAVMKYPESEWFDEALYKQAWAQYRLSNPEKAISSFLALVDLGGPNVSGKSLLEKESMDYIAISFSETDPTGSNGLDRALAFAKKLGDVDRGCNILQRLASVYREQGRFDMAKKTFDTLLSTYPYYSGNPVVESELITLLERDESPDEINVVKYDFYKQYSKNSAWISTQKDTFAIKIADSLAERQLYGAAIGYHQIALQKNEASVYRQALDAYREYIRAYPASHSANECHYNLAEIQFSIGNYKEAAEEYMAVSKRYPDSKYRETAAWNAIVASQNCLKQEYNNK